MSKLRQLLVSSFKMVFLVSAVACNEEPQTPQPNILWIFSEDLSPFFGCYGDSINKGFTPAIDGLAEQGVMFSRAYATAPVCSPSRSALITGIMQTTTGTHQHRSSRWTDGEVVPEELRIYLPDYVQTIPELMKSAGYFTFNSGKDDYNFHYDRTQLYDVGNAHNYLLGMNGWQGNRAEHSLSITEDTWNARKDKTQPWFGQIELAGGKAFARHVREGEQLENLALTPPPYFPDIPSQRRAWTIHYNACRGADARVEAILEQLEADGELENTIVFFFSDHGSNTSLRHKQFCYEGGLHVPLIIAGNHPSIKKGKIVSDLVTLLDISATTLALGGVKLPDYLDGQDLLGNNYSPHEYVIGARDRCDYTIDRIRTVRTDQFRYIRNFYPERPLMQAGYRDNHPMVQDMWRLYNENKLNEYQAKHWFGVRPEEELYDIANDPHQINNLAERSDYNDILAEHRELLINWMQETDDQGQYPEDKVQLKATYDLWKDEPIFKNAHINSEFNHFK
jgi:arylsulfatase A-like enzyme